MKLLIVIFFAIIIICNSCDNQLNEFQKCYPKEKFDLIERAIEKLDNAVQEKFPSKNVNESYIKYAKNWIDNGSEIEYLLTSSEWIIMARSSSDLPSTEFLEKHQWEPLIVREPIYWTDNFSSILSILK